MKLLFNPERRICVVIEEKNTTTIRRGDAVIKKERKAKERRAFFHLFTTKAFPLEPSPLRGGHPGGQVSTPLAIVEYEDGTVETVEPHRVRFLDTAELMEQYAWGEATEDDDTTAEWVDMKEALSCHCSKCGCIVRHDLTPERCPKCGRTMRSREQNPERSCLTCKHNENGINRPCSDCKDGIYDKWEEEPKWYEEQ